MFWHFLKIDFSFFADNQHLNLSEVSILKNKLPLDNDPLSIIVTPVKFFKTGYMSEDPTQPAKQNRCTTAKLHMNQEAKRLDNFF